MKILKLLFKRLEEKQFNIDFRKHGNTITKCGCSSVVLIH